MERLLGVEEKRQVVEVMVGKVVMVAVVDVVGMVEADGMIEQVADTIEQEVLDQGKILLKTFVVQVLGFHSCCLVQILHHILQSSREILQLHSHRRRIIHKHHLLLQKYERMIWMGCNRN